MLDRENFMLKQMGAMYLILGTCVAAGMLGLPIATAQNSYGLTVMMVLSAWSLMTLGAWCLLQVNLWLEPGTNLISMSSQTLGPVIKSITWVVYLMLLYSLICAYLAASGDVFQTLLSQIHIHIPRWLATVSATVILGGIVYRGIRSVDLVNRFLMTVKLLVCLLLILAVIPHAHTSMLKIGGSQWHGASWLVIVCSFGYAIILPSIREYLQSNKKQLTIVLLIGSILPVILYLVWIAVIQGALTRSGVHGLLAMNGSDNTNSMLMLEIVRLTHYGFIQSIGVMFISICSVTGLLGVSLCLMDFLADGLHKEKQGHHKIILAAITFTPPMLIVLLRPSIFIHALAYAGMCCLYILVALPIAMYIVGKFNGLASIKGLHC